MPKGALLHAHLDATVNADFLLKIALKQPALHVCVSEPLSAQNLSIVLPQFKALPEEMFTESSMALTDSTYLPNTWVPLNKARETFDQALGGPKAFEEGVIGAMTINPTEGKLILDCCYS